MDDSNFFSRYYLFRLRSISYNFFLNNRKIERHKLVSTSLSRQTYLYKGSSQLWFKTFALKYKLTKSGFNGVARKLAWEVLELNQNKSALFTKTFVISRFLPLRDIVRVDWLSDLCTRLITWLSFIYGVPAQLHSIPLPPAGP